MGKESMSSSPSNTSANTTTTNRKRKRSEGVKKPKQKGAKKAPKSARKERKKSATTKLPPRNSIIRAPSSSWIMYIKDQRSKRPEEFNKKMFGDVYKVLSKEWSGMTAEQKAPYVEMYQEDRARYKEALGKLSKSDICILKAHRKLARSKRNKQGRPKTALSTYMVAVTKERPALVEANPGMTFTQIGSELGKMWQNLPEERRKEYEAISLKDKQRYKEEMAVWRAQQTKLRAKRKEEAEAKREAKRRKVEQRAESTESAES